MTHRAARAVLAVLIAWIGAFLFWEGAAEAALGSSTVVRAGSGPVQIPAAGSSRRFELGPGESWNTAYYVTGPGNGPVVMVVAGLHGNEPAGAAAAERVKDYTIRRGTLIVLPRANVYGLARGVRHDQGGSDLNRDFPRASGERADTPLARAIWDVVLRYRPDWLIDLHEGYDYHVHNSKSVGQSVIYDPNGPEVAEAARRIAAALNREAPASERFSIIKYPVRGGIARSASDLLDVKAMIVETNRVDDEFATRVRYHEIAVRTLLDYLGML